MTGVQQMTGSTHDRRAAAGGEIRATARPFRFLGWLILLAFVIGLVSLLSYSLTASELIRSDNPAFAAWWEAHQFYFMEGGATALGLLLAIRIGGTLVAGPDRRSRAGLAAVVLAVIAFAPLIHVCAVVARLGWNGRASSFASWIISREGYDTGRQIDKIMIGGVYFSKTAGLALLAGLGLMAIACVTVIAFESANTEMDQS